MTTAAARPRIDRKTARPAIGNWTERAACRAPGTDPEVFFPASDTPPPAQLSAARKICARCFVRAHCLDWALRTGEPAGIWAGTTPAERRFLRTRPHSG
jgi:WhiB family redox-sensing transcriptional regulator